MFRWHHQDRKTICVHFSESSFGHLCSGLANDRTHAIFFVENIQSFGALIIIFIVVAETSETKRGSTRQKWKLDLYIDCLLSIMENIHLNMKNSEKIASLSFYSDQLLKNHAKLWQSKKLCDVILVAGVDAVKCVIKLISRYHCSSIIYGLCLNGVHFLIVAEYRFIAWSWPQRALTFRRCFVHL